MKSELFLFLLFARQTQATKLSQHTASLACDTTRRDRATGLGLSGAWACVSASDVDDEDEGSRSGSGATATTTIETAIKDGTRTI